MQFMVYQDKEEMGFVFSLALDNSVVPQNQ